MAKPLRILPDLLQAALQGDARRIESLSMTAIRNLRTHFPELAKELGVILVSHHGGADPSRLTNIDPPPVDADSSIPLLRVEVVGTAKRPQFSPLLTKEIERFIRERRDSAKLVAEGVLPPRSVLLMGPPGTGKTVLARNLACETGLKLVTLDLASAVSSYLGKTGMNLRRVLDYARATPCLLLLDEFDSIAKKRDDATDVGELKRIVNVLLKELEDWPAHSVLVAATNHPELLDSAISRRFDRIFSTELPEAPERIQILQQSLGRFAEGLQPAVIQGIGAVLEGKSGADIEKVAEGAIRRHLVDAEPLERAMVAEIRTVVSDRSKEATGKLLRALKPDDTDTFTVRELAEAFDLSPSTVQYHLKKAE